METLEFLLVQATPVQLLTVAFVLLAVCFVFVKSSRSPRRYPPGPSQLPILGNVHNFPADNWGIVFGEWQKEYGDIVYAQLPGTPFVIINSLEIAQELLSKHARINSDRRLGYMVMEEMGWNWAPAFMKADAIHAKERTMFRRGIGVAKMPLKDPLIERNAGKLVLDLQNLKGNPNDTVIKIVGLTVIELAYGRGIVKDYGQEMIAINVKGMSMLNEAIQTVWAVNLIPLLRYLPTWMPGAGFKRLGAYSRNLAKRIREWPFELAVERHKAGTLDHCLVDDLLNEFGASFEVQDAVANLYFAGVDTTSTVLTQFLHIMFLFPEVAKRVQAEIDAAIGRERMPTVKDRSDLPYTNAVWKEALRFTGAVPLALPRCSTEDQIVSGYFIPKGSMINPHFGFMLKDPKIWGDPDIFRPERFLSTDGSTLPDPTVLIFGFGTRVCPGMHFADRTGFHLATTVITLFNILPLPGQTVPRYADVEYTRTFFRLPAVFDCVFTPRDEQAEYLLSSLALN